MTRIVVDKSTRTTLNHLAKSHFYDNCKHMNLKFMRRVSERERAIRPFVVVKNKLMSVLCACPVIDNEFRHHIVKVVSGSTRLL